MNSFQCSPLNKGFSFAIFALRSLVCWQNFFFNLYWNYLLLFSIIKRLWARNFYQLNIGDERFKSPQSNWPRSKLLEEENEQFIYVSITQEYSAAKWQNDSFDFWTSCPKINRNPLPSLQFCTSSSKYLFYLVWRDLSGKLIRVFGDI